MTHKSYALDITQYSSDDIDKKYKQKIDLELKLGTMVELQRENYERIEFLGDKIIDAIISEYVYERFPYNQEGFLTKLKSKLVRSETLAILSRDLGLTKYILLSKNVDLRHGRNYACYLEDVLEGFIGALYQDLGFSICRTFFRTIIEKYINFVDLIIRNDNYKDLLLKFFQKNGWGDPKYKQISSVGPPQNRIFTMVALHNKNIIGQGYGPNKKKAEQNSAKMALDEFGYFNNE